MMKKISFIVIFSCLACGMVYANGFSVSVQSAWHTKESQQIYSAGYMIPSSRTYQYYEGGGVFLPSGSSKTIMREPGNYSRQYPNTLFGFYGGYYLYLMPIFRPGILFGTVLRNDAVWDSIDNRNYYLHSYTEYRVDYYMALSIQAGVFSFVVSNHGIGGGLNYMFGRGEGRR